VNRPVFRTTTPTLGNRNAPFFSWGRLHYCLRRDAHAASEMGQPASRAVRSNQSAEELIAYVADQEGYFEDEHVHVAMRDGIRWETERSRGGATIGLGRAMLTRLTGGVNWTALAVNAHRPLFWFMGGAGVKSWTIFVGADWRYTHPAPRPAVSRGSCCACTAWTRIAT
jgi:hypothetical protein